MVKLAAQDEAWTPTCCRQTRLWAPVVRIHVCFSCYSWTSPLIWCLVSNTYLGVLCFYLQKEENGKILKTLPSSQNQFLQSGLGPGQEYEVSISVVKNNTQGPQTSKRVTTSESKLITKQCCVDGFWTWRKLPAHLLKSCEHNNWGASGESFFKVGTDVRLNPNGEQFISFCHRSQRSCLCLHFNQASVFIHNACGGRHTKSELESHLSWEKLKRTIMSGEENLSRSRRKSPLTVPANIFYIKIHYWENLNISWGLTCSHSFSHSVSLDPSCSPLPAGSFIAVCLHTLRCEMLPVACVSGMARKRWLCMEKPFTLQVCLGGLQGYCPISFLMSCVCVGWTWTHWRRNE